MLRILLVLIGAAAAVVGVLGFRGQTSGNRPWHVFLDMKYQAKYNAQGQSDFFADGRSSRQPVASTIPYDGGTYRADAGDHGESNPAFLPGSDDVYFTGKTGPTDFVERIPKKAVETAVFSDGKLAYAGWDALLRRGQERYMIHCAVCHGDTGYGGQGDTAHGAVGRGIIDPVTGKRRAGMIGIASYHDPRLREAADGYLFDVITNGKNTMAAYGHQVPVQDRWAIVAYLRALQLSQNAPESLVEQAERSRLMGGAK